MRNWSQKTLYKHVLMKSKILKVFIPHGKKIILIVYKVKS